MATTTNYGWTTPDDTALVKDGASAIRTLGSSIDTSVKSLSPGTTAGDVDYYTSSTAKARLGIGTTGQVLTVAGGVPSWANAASGSMTQIASGSLTGASVTISSISGSYKDLALIIRGYGTSGNTNCGVSTNSDTSNYGMAGVQSSNGTSSLAGTAGGSRAMIAWNNNPLSNSQNSARFYIVDYVNSSTQKNMILSSISAMSAAPTWEVDNIVWRTPTTAAITQLVLNSGGTWSAGTYILYGVN
jgi:hypothetical protein